MFGGIFFQSEGEDGSISRKTITVRYGYITFVVSLLFVLGIPLSAWLYDQFLYNLTSRITGKINTIRLRSNVLTVNFPVIKILLFWVPVLGVLSCLQVYGDFHFLAARLGRVATYCLPTIFFLTLRPSPLPDTLYLSLVPIHKWLSRLVVLMGLAHTGLYLWYMTLKHTLYKLLKFKNVTGILATIAFVIIVVTSLPFFRRKYYNFFFINHYICSWIIVISLFFHARPGIPYITALNTAILLYQIYYRVSMTKASMLDVVDISANIQLVIIPNEGIPKKSGIPGCHIRMIDYDPSFRLKSLWKNYLAPIQHPFTLSTLAGDETQKLIIRKGAFELNNEKKYLLTGAYLPYLRFIKPRRRGNSRSLMFNVKAKRCLIIVGGSAISYALPVMRILNYNGCVAKIIWVVREYEDLKVLNYYQNIFTDDDCIDIFITGKYDTFEKEAFMADTAELRRRRSERDIREQNRVLNQETEIDFNMPTPNVSAKSPRNFSATDSLASDPYNYYYGSAIDDDLESGLSPKEHYRSALAAKHRNSSGSLRNKATYSFTEENTFENVDVDLDRTCDRPRQVSDSSGICENKDNEFCYDPKLGRVSSKALSSGFSAGLIPVGSPSIQTEKLDNYWILGNMSCRIEFGRPKLGVFYYNWCVKSSCIGPLVDLKTGQSVCCNEIPVNGTKQKSNSGLKYKKSNGKLLGTEDEDELFLNERFIRHRNDRLANPSQSQDKIWVVAAGPVGLVNNVSLWARDCGFHFHAESFSI
ncbi:unnamed protein product [Kuraishia capsulata CBS 1993]|uniref:Ferric oxidoreductase domain-containing protein n=1 Tax=Kuraishia capsulata CBS 1993 TaxID=1382522 RepID=W6MH00_9ASCO|nr:uncharacterized protein KUCA_T00000870001 [Kuraishia capsulata CBS 1993]CDK24903.1 unnamed protein product [Kuraishia capsulata CBS 1993]